MKQILTFILVLTFSFPAHAADKETTYDRVMKSRTLRCGYFIWPPHMAKDAATGQLSGVYYNIVEQLGKVLNLKIEWSYEYTFGQQVEALRSGKMDALCGDGPWTRSAIPYLDYTHEYLFIPAYAYVAASNPKKLTFDKLNSPDVTFTLMDGDGSAEYLDTLFPNSKRMSMPSTSDPSMLIQNVLTGKADAMLNDPISIEAQGAHNKEKLIALNPERPLTVAPMIISVPKGEQSLLNTLNQGIDLLNDSGFLEKTLKKYDPTGKKLMAPKERYRTQ